MNKIITIYDLLGLIKDNKAPKKIKYKGKIYIFAGDDYSVNDDLEEWLFSEYDYLTTLLNEQVEIIEEDKDIEEITSGELCSASYTNEQLRADVDILENKLNEVIRKVNKLRKENK